MAKITVLEPVAEPRPVMHDLSPRLDTLEGKRIGFLSNTKPNADKLFEAIEARLRERFKLGSVVMKAKPIAAGPAEQATYDALAREADVAIVAIGD